MPRLASRPRRGLSHTSVRSMAQAFPAFCVRRREVRAAHRVCDLRRRADTLEPWLGACDGDDHPVDADDA
eukprot:12237970-Heterocapsa_arctica.AAC.1